jgi:hypothetical protein
VAFVALFDACVLDPAPLRDLRMRLAGTRPFRARWSAEVDAEWMTAVVRDRPEPAGRLALTRKRMDARFRIAWSAGTWRSSLCRGYPSPVTATFLPPPSLDGPT